MTKTEFLQQLYNHLSVLDTAERNDIIADFEEHFAAGLEQGKTEEQICAELGNPYTCALQYLRGAGNYTQAPQQPTPPPQQRTVPQGTPQPTAGSARQINDRRNKTLWAVVFFAALVCAVGVYPAGAALMLAPIALLIASIVLMTIVPSGAMIGFLISLGVMCFTAGLLMILLMSWILRLSYQRADF